MGSACDKYSWRGHSTHANHTHTQTSWGDVDATCSCSGTENLDTAQLKTLKHNCSQPSTCIHLDKDPAQLWTHMTVLFSTKRHDRAVRNYSNRSHILMCSAQAWKPKLFSGLQLPANPIKDLSKSQHCIQNCSIHEANNTLEKHWQNKQRNIGTKLHKLSTRANQAIPQ